jgi:hypothetical protein
MKTQLKLILLFTGAVTLLTACQQRSTENQVNTRSAPVQQLTHINSASVIPSENGHKTQTTNERGSTTYGLGTSVYSLIGSSSLHSDGFSSHLESRLSGEGISGVRVFVFDDTVILAAESRQASASQYDPLQQKVLSSTGGQSGKGPEPNQDIGTQGSGKTADDNLAQAEQRIKPIMGGNVKVLTVTGSEAVEAINRIRKNTAASASPQVISDDLRTLLKLTASNAK